MGHWEMAERVSSKIPSDTSEMVASHHGTVVRDIWTVLKCTLSEGNTPLCLK